MNAVCAVPSVSAFVRSRAKLINLSTVAVVSIVAFREDDNAFPAGGGKQEEEDQGDGGGGGDEGVGASGSLRSLVIFITRKRLTLLFVSLPYESLPRSIFKLIGHSNEFSLFSRHYKYNLEREYFAVPHPINRSTSHPSSFFILSAMKENFGGKIRRFLSLSRSYRARFHFDIKRTWYKHRRDSRFVSISFPSIFPEKCIFQLHFLSTSSAY